MTLAPEQLSIDLDQAARFIEALAGDRAAQVTFQTYDDHEERKKARPKHERDPLARIRHGSLEQHAKWLADMQAQGAGVYVTVNQTDLKGRAATNVTALRAVFVDDDEAAIADPFVLQLEPSIVVRAKRGRHVYWRLVAGQQLAEFRDAQRGLIHHLRTDRQIHDLPRVMRLPGFWHLKDPSAPFLVTIEHVGDAVYTLDQVRAVWPAPVEPKPEPVSYAPPATTRTPQAENFARWAACKPIEDGTRHDSLKAIIAEGLGRVQARAISEEDALGVVLDYCRRSGIGEGERVGVKLWNSMRGKRFTAHLPENERVVYAAGPAKGPADSRSNRGEQSPYPSAAASEGAGEPTQHDALRLPADEPMDSYGAGDEAEPAGDRPSKFRLFTPDELAGLPPLTWQVDRTVPRGGFIVIYGPSGGGKSFICIDLALCISEGLPWGGRLVEQGHVVYVSGEGISGLSQRIRAWQLHNNRMDKLTHVHFITEAVDLRNKAEVVDLVKQIETLPVKPALVVLDTLARCMVGGDENSAKDVGEAIAACDYIRKRTGGGVCLVHHTSKQKPDQERGSSSLRGAADTMVLVNPQKGRIRLSCEKQKDGEAFEPSFWRLVPVEAIGSCVPVQLGGELGNARESDDQADSPESKLSENDLMVLRTVRNHTEDLGGIILSDVSRATGLGKSSVRNALTRLRNRGFILYDEETTKYHTGRSIGSTDDLNGDESRDTQTQSYRPVQPVQPPHEQGSFSFHVTDEGPDYGYVPVNPVKPTRSPVQFNPVQGNRSDLNGLPEGAVQGGEKNPPIGGFSQPEQPGVPERVEAELGEAEYEEGEA